MFMEIFFLWSFSRRFWVECFSLKIHDYIIINFKYYEIELYGNYKILLDLLKEYKNICKIIMVVVINMYLNVFILHKMVHYVRISYILIGCILIYKIYVHIQCP